MPTVLPQQNSPARIAPLSVLPVFFDLKGKRVVVIGGEEPATWKIELLAASGPQVEVYAETVCEELQALAAASTHITLNRRRWTADDLEGAALAVADIAADEDAESFVDAARIKGVPYNVIDRPEFCQFQFGAIVNRSPVVIGISTSGAAPILGQAIRRRIETLLPPTLAHWAALAARLRETVTAHFAAGAPRRHFWEQLAEKAFGPTPPQAADAEVGSAVAFGGKVTLVGAGPGEAELLTLKAVRALQSADVILFDDLISADVLELARREAKRMLVGKRAARESCRQEDINEMMLQLAKQGKHVVRLKSGDPMIFGRAGEEIEMLERHGVEVSVVPGITTALALASRLGISLTHRDHAQSVRFVTGHSRKGRLPEGLNWSDLADQKTTSVYYMSRRTLPDIVHELRRNGMDGETPMVVASNVGRATEQIWHGNLATALSSCDAFPVDEPTIVAIGAALRKRPAVGHMAEDRGWTRKWSRVELEPRRAMGPQSRP